jgi:hypothetical protein
MPETLTYAQASDLDWGNIPAPANAEYWLQKGSDEIDSKIGFLYATPIVLGNSAEERPGRLLLRRINEWLAMGRAILSIDAGNEDDQLHQLGLYYVTEANNALAAIVNGSIVLTGATPASPTTDQQTGPMITNVDETSFVEDFRSAFGDPASTVLNTPRPTVLGNRYTW